jgi:hypothetical protein
LQRIGEVKTGIIQVNRAAYAVTRHSSDVVGQACLHDSSIEGERRRTTHRHNAAYCVTGVSEKYILQQVVAVNISAIRAGKAEMALGNVLGSCIFNTLMVSSVASTLGNIAVPSSLLTFALPMMLASGVLFYLLTQDKRMSAWEGWLFVCLYGLFMLKTAGF